MSSEHMKRKEVYKKFKNLQKSQKFLFLEHLLADSKLSESMFKKEISDMDEKQLLFIEGELDGIMRRNYKKQLRAMSDKDLLNAIAMYMAGSVDEAIEEMVKHAADSGELYQKHPWTER